MTIKCPPPIPLLWQWAIPTHKPVAIAASTADPLALNISLENKESFNYFNHNLPNKMVHTLQLLSNIHCLLRLRIVYTHRELKV